MPISFTGTIFSGVWIFPERKFPKRIFPESFFLDWKNPQKLEEVYTCLNGNIKVINTNQFSQLPTFFTSILGQLYNSSIASVGKIMKMVPYTYFIITIIILYSET